MTQHNFPLIPVPSPIFPLPKPIIHPPYHPILQSLPYRASTPLCTLPSHQPPSNEIPLPHTINRSRLSPPLSLAYALTSLDSDNMSSLTQGILQDLAIDKFNETAQDRITQKDPYSAAIPQGLSKRDADVLRRCKRRAHQLDHNAVLCYCCPCFFGLNTAICTILSPVAIVTPPRPQIQFAVSRVVCHKLQILVRLGLCCVCYYSLLWCRSWCIDFRCVGLIPVIGPIWANSLSGRVIKMAEEADIPATLTAKMSANITFDFLVSHPSLSFPLFALTSIAICCFDLLGMFGVHVLR